MPEIEVQAQNGPRRKVPMTDGRMIIGRGEVSLHSPVARALLRARRGDVVKLQAPTGVEELEVVEIRYPGPA